MQSRQVILRIQVPNCNEVIMDKSFTVQVNSAIKKASASASAFSVSFLFFYLVGNGRLDKQYVVTKQSAIRLDHLLDKFVNFVSLLSACSALVVVVEHFTGESTSGG